jgi:hypothetical protein
VSESERERERERERKRTNENPAFVLIQKLLFIKSHLLVTAELYAH